MTIKDLREKNETELKKTLAELQDDLRKLRFSRASGQLKDMRAMRVNRRTIARILTLLQMKSVK